MPAAGGRFAGGCQCGRSTGYDTPMASAAALGVSARRGGAGALPKAGMAYERNLAVGLTSDLTLKEVLPA